MFSPHLMADIATTDTITLPLYLLHPAYVVQLSPILQMAEDIKFKVLLSDFGTLQCTRTKVS